MEEEEEVKEEEEEVVEQEEEREDAFRFLLVADGGGGGARDCTEEGDIGASGWGKREGAEAEALLLLLLTSARMTTLGLWGLARRFRSMCSQ